MDMIRAEINAAHRFHSFAGERSHNFVKWSVCYVTLALVRYAETLIYRHIDGHDYMYALSEMLESARECIFILVRSLGAHTPTC